MAQLFLALATVGLIEALAPNVAAAHSYKLGKIAVGHVWALPPEKGAMGVPVYGPILNRSNTPVRLVGASTPVAKEVRFRVVRAGGIRWLETIALAPDKPVALAPWRQHIWLAVLNRGFKYGGKFDLTLDFGKSGKLTIEVIVEQVSGH